MCEDKWTSTTSKQSATMSPKAEKADGWLKFLAWEGIPGDQTGCNMNTRREYVVG
jgi:hypothetical protein